MLAAGSFARNTNRFYPSFKDYVKQEIIISFFIKTGRHCLVSFEAIALERGQCNLRDFSDIYSMFLQTSVAKSQLCNLIHLKVHFGSAATNLGSLAINQKEWTRAGEHWASTNPLKRMKMSGDGQKREPALNWILCKVYNAVPAIDS